MESKNDALIEKAKQAKKQIKQKEAISNDKEFNKWEHIDKHEALYTDILKTYTDNINKTLLAKHEYKQCFFWVSIIILITTFILLAGVLGSISSGTIHTDFLGYIPLIASTTITFLTIFIVIPKIITKYLFNSEEEKYMYQIIKSIQDYDKEKS